MAAPVEKRQARLAARAERKEFVVIAVWYRTMREIVLETAQFRWIDVTDPSDEELAALAAEHGIHPLAVEDCLDPQHLPKYERMGTITLVILRAFDENCAPDADTVHKITRKVVFFFNDQLLITVHRKQQRFLEELKRAAPTASVPRSESVCGFHVLSIANAMVDSFWRPLEEAEARISAIEEREERTRNPMDFVHEVFQVKRRINAIRSTSRHILETVKKLTAGTAEHMPPSARQNDLREHAESLYFAIDEILEDVNSLLSLTLATADHQTNQIMKVLTIFSAFFLPLTFIVGVYGMNFDVMPELRWRYGYPVVLVVMALICGGIYRWFRRNGWL
jgi:magnesium transporter